MDSFHHESDDKLELYALGRLSGSDLAQTEGHLFLCTQCRDRLDNVGEFAVSMREALIAEPLAVSRVYARWMEWFTPRLAMAGAFAALVLALGVYWVGVGARVAAVASLQLTAMRGEMPTVGIARELDLTLTDAAVRSGPFRLEVVDGSGGGIWAGVPDQGTRGLQAKVRYPLSPGDYFARLYGASGELLHEYGFHIKGYKQP